MSGEEDFLKRWSRRKREAVEVAKSDPPAARAGDGESKAAPNNDVASDKSAGTPQSEFDPASLPSIESITALSDVTAFLRAGVPTELTRAALRRVWITDPAIRDFVGLAENAWDFTDPNAMPGFGPLESTEEVRQMIARVVDHIGKTAQSDAAEMPPERTDDSPTSHDSNVIGPASEGDDGPLSATPVTGQTGEHPAEMPTGEVLLQSNKVAVATQRDAPEEVEKPRQLSRRTHGGALPRELKI